MEIREIGTVAVSQFLGRGIQEGVATIDRPVIESVTLKNLVGIAGGLAGALLALSRYIPAGLKLPVAIVSTKLLADEIVDVAKGVTAGAAVIRAPVIRVAPPMVARAAPELVKVD